MITTALITKNQIIISIITLSILTIFDLILLFKNIEKVDFKLNLKNCFKYDSVSCSIYIMFFIIYLFGFSNSFSFGEKYIVAITFSTLVTDIQWDMSSAIMSIIMYPIYKPEIMIVSIFILLHIVDFIMTPFKNIKICYLELEHSVAKTTINTIIAYIIRTFISLLPTPFCTILGQICSSTYEFIYAKINYRKQQQQFLVKKE